MAIKYYSGINIAGNIVPSADSTYNIGAPALRFTNVYADNLYGDLSGSIANLTNSIQINGTTVIDSNRNLSAGTISGTTGSFSGNITVESESTPALILKDTTNDLQARIRAANNYVYFDADSPNTVTSTRMVFQVDGGEVVYYNQNQDAFFANDVNATTFIGDLTGDVTGSASLNVLKTGDTMTGTLVISTGSDNKIDLRTPSGDTSDWNYINFYGRDGARDSYIGIDADGDMKIYSDKNSYGISLYSYGLQIDSNVNIATGVLQIGSTTVIDSSRNISATTGTFNSTVNLTSGVLQMNGSTVIGNNKQISALGASFTNPVTIYDVSTSENPRLSLGRQAVESINFDVDDVNAVMYFRQDTDSNADHVQYYTIDSDSTGDKKFIWQRRAADGTSAVSKLILDADGLDIRDGGSLQMNSTAVIDSSRNITANTISSAGSITSSGSLNSNSGALYLTDEFGARVFHRRNDSTVTNNELLSQIDFQADDPTNASFNTGARIKVSADGTWDAGTYPTKIQFYTDSSGTLTEAFSIDSNQDSVFAGDVSIGGTLTVDGTIDLSNANLDIGAADIVFDIDSATAGARGLIWDFDGDGNGVSSYIGYIRAGGLAGEKMQFNMNAEGSVTGSNTIYQFMNGGTDVFTIGREGNLSLRAITNGAGSTINFSDHASGSYAQQGNITYYHVDTASYGSGNAFAFTSTEASLTVLADGKLMFKEGLYLKPSSGTGGGTIVIDSNGAIRAYSAPSNSLPAYSFNGDTDTGLSRIADNAVGLVAGGSRKFYVTGTNAYFQNLSGGVSMPDLTLTGSLKGPSTFYIDPSPDDTGEPGGATTDTGTVVILGNLQVTGTTTTIDSTTLNVGDLNIVLAKDATTAAAANGAGITINGANATMTYDSTNDRFNFNKAIASSTHVTSGANVYSGTGGQFRNYAGVWQATTGVSGNGFGFISADGTAMTISSTGFVDINNGLLVNGGGSNFDTIRIEAPNASVYYKDSDSNTAWHLGSNGDYFYLLEDTDRNGVYNIINSRWDTGGYEQYTGNIDNRVGSYQIAGTTVIDANKNAYATVFYDLDNTLYKVDPASSSSVNILTVNGTLTLGSLTNNTTATFALVNAGGGVVQHRQLGSLAFLNSVSSTLDDVTTNGNSTSNSISVGTVSASGGLQLPVTGYTNVVASYFNTIQLRTSSTGGTIQIGGNGTGWVNNNLKVGNGNLEVVGNIDGEIFRDIDNTVYYVDPANTGTSANFAGKVQATQMGVTNIVTNKVVKFNGSILDDSNITDTGSLITLGSQTTVSGDVTINPSTNYALYIGRMAGQPNIKSSDSYAFMDSNGGWAGLNWYASDNVALANGGGSVAIGSASITQKLTVHGTVGATVYYDKDDTSYYLNPSNTSISSKLAGKILVGGNATPNHMVHITSDGTSSNRGLRINSTATGGFSEAVFDSDSGEFRIGVGGSTTGSFYNNKFYFYHATNGDLANIDSSGNFTTNGFLTISRGADKKIRFSDTRTGANTFSIEHDASQIYLYNETTASSLLEIENNGNIGVGLSPIYKFDVNGTLGVRNGTIQTNGSTTSFNFLSGGTAKGAKVAFLLASSSYSSTPSTGQIWATDSMQSPIYYDYNNTSYYVNPNADSSFGGSLGLVGDLDLALGSYITFYGNGSGDHGITSRNHLGNATDDLRINSYGAVYINLDSNNNNTSTASFEIGRHGSTGTISDWLFKVDGETGDTDISGDLTVSGSLTIGGAGGNLVKIYENQNYVASDPTSTGSRTNYGQGLTVYEGYSSGTNRPHTYDTTLQIMSTDNQGFELSADWVSDTKTPLKIRSLRDCCQGWSPWREVMTAEHGHSGNFFTTGYIRAGIFYDQNDTNYFVDPATAGNGTVLNGVKVSYLGVNASANTSGSYRINMGGAIDMNANNIDYINQLHFSDGVRFYDNGDDSYLNFRYGDATQGGIRFLDSGVNQMGFLFANTSGFGLLSADGTWAVRTTNSLTIIDHRLDTPAFYDSDNTAYYVNPNGNSVLNTISAFGLSVNTLSVSNTATVTSTVQHGGLVMTSGGNVDQIYEASMSFTLTADTWTDTGINSTDLSTGTYVVQVFVSDHNAGGGHYSEYYSGTMSWYASNTNSTNVDEIVLHNAGHASNASHLQLRTQRHSNGGDDLMLQVKQNFTHTTALDGTSGKQMIFKFRRLI